MTHKLIKTENYLLVVDDSEIKIGECYLSSSGIWFYNLFNPNHNKECNKIISYLPLNDSLILQGVPLLPPIEYDVEQLALNNWDENDERTGVAPYIYQFGFIDGYNKAREKYIEEPIEKLWEEFRIQHPNTVGGFHEQYQSFAWLFNKMNGKQYPTEFECEMIDFEVDMGIGEECVEHRKYPKTITTTQGVQWVGKYLYS